MTDNIVIRKMLDTDWPAVKNIYLEGIATGNATFQTDAPSFEEWTTSHHATCRLVAVKEGLVIGWISISSVSNRIVYKGVGEVSIYVSTKLKNGGIGTALFTKLIEVSEKEGFWTLQSSIFKENIASLKLHKKMGFREVGYREKIAKHHDIWRDVLILERRSKKLN
ncbi:N-acetyltransferase family protein [Rummeliibacillus stabekisii]|uniref:GNAT family N-acetyltransferase n=1 Tax=Rummeliibacillus stabekisii TaxID=241244 RepID=UPI00203C4EB4|nr:GNAT family N-acetyltransferase [Rummeliibacillus stabekisii]MCM3317933.1 N-acetyltransferase family protein [Rummeliibacillus stabekisii]